MHRQPRRLARAVTLILALCAIAAPGAALADNYVALGDSYSSGTGTNSYTLNSGCMRGVYAYPYLVAQQRANTSLNFVACSGATTSDVMNNQVSAVTGSTNIVTMTIGGNDIGFANLLVQCTLANCNTALTNTMNALPGSLNSKLDTVYGAIKSRAPGATVVILGYPRLFSSSSCWGTTGISSSERSNGNLLADKLDQTIAAKAAQYGFTYKSAISAFSGHAVCSSSAWLNGLNIFATSESFHPNRAGHSSGYAPLVRSVIG